MRNLFDPGGMLMRAMSDLASLVVLNLLTLLFCVPVITAGASLSAMYYVLYQMADRGEGKVARTFLREFRSNLKSGVPLTLIFLAILGIGAMEYRLFQGMDGAARLMIAFLYAGAVLLMCLFVWVFPLTAKFVYSTGAVLKNAMILAVMHLVRTLAMAAIMVVIPFVLTQDMHLVPLSILLGISFPAYLCMLICHPVLKKMAEDR